MSSSVGSGLRASSALAAIIMPGVQKPHCRPCSSVKPSCSGCSSLAAASPSTVSISWPSAWTANIVHDLTGVPSTSTVHAPQLLVSQPVWVPVSRSPYRIRWASSSRGSTSAVFFSPLMVNEIRRTGTSPASSRAGSEYNVVISGRPLRRLAADAAQDALDERRHNVPLVFRTAPVVCPGPGRRGRQRGGFADRLGGERPAGECRGGVGGGDRRSADAGQRDARLGDDIARTLYRDRDADGGEVANAALELEVAAGPLASRRRDHCLDCYLVRGKSVLERPGDELGHRDRPPPVRALSDHRAL